LRWAGARDTVGHGKTEVRVIRGHLTRRGLALTAGAMVLTPSVAGARTRIPMVVRTLAGAIRLYPDGDVVAARGVPYGRADRFQPPLPSRPWRDEFRADRFGPASPQRGSEPNQSEDCLRLNVWTPDARPGRRPVIVYIHGGAYATGSGSNPLTDGARLAAKGDVVVVTVNHRLGPLGYASLARLAPGFEDSGIWASWIWCWRCSGCGTISRPSAAIRAASPWSASRAAGPRSPP